MRFLPATPDFGPRRMWPLAPVLVAAVGILAAVLAGLIGASALRRTSDAAAQLHADTLADALAARLRESSVEVRAELVQRAGSRTGADVLLVDHRGRVVVDATLGAPPEDVRLDCLIRGEGSLDTAIGRVRYSARPLGPPLEHLDVIVFVPAPATPSEVARLAQAILVLTALLVGVAAAVAWSFARSVRDDVAHVTAQIDTMSAIEDAPLAAIAVRSFDQIGVLTSAFDALADRFAAATRASRRDLKLAEEHDRDRRAFLAALSHELRTPLHAILGFTEVLLAEVDGPLDDDAREGLEVVRRSALHLAALIDEVLDLSALEWGERSLDLAEGDVAAIARDAVAEARPVAEGKGLAIAADAEAPARARVDERRIRQVVGNLVGNAVKFTSRGDVRVTVRAEEGWVVLSVRDTGPGISAADRARIFEAFRQGGDAKQKRRGTGLGLAIAQRLVAMHGGRLEVESEVGAGATFRVRLPTRGPEAAP